MGTGYASCPVHMVRSPGLLVLGEGSKVACKHVAWTYTACFTPQMQRGQRARWSGGELHWMGDQFLGVQVLCSGARAALGSPFLNMGTLVTVNER